MQRTDQPPNVHTLLTALADRLVAKHASHAMTEPLALAQVLVVAEHAYGPTKAAETAERAITAVLPPVRPGDTRDAYAARLRLIVTGAVA